MTTVLHPLANGANVRFELLADRIHVYDNDTNAILFLILPNGNENYGQLRSGLAGNGPWNVGARSELLVCGSDGTPLNPA